MIATVVRESASSTGGQAAVMLGAAAIVVGLGCVVYCYHREIARHLRVLLERWRDEPRRLAHRDLARAAARTTEGSGRWLG